jgi:hypothetical protein
MGKSKTIHCIGHAPKGDGDEQLFFAMNRREVAQQIAIARKKGVEIEYWRAQTKTGDRILGKKTALPVYTHEIKLPKMVICPACGGNKTKYYCPVCNSSGITTPGFEKGWKPWQIQEIQQDAGLR